MDHQHLESARNRLLENQTLENMLQENGQFLLDILHKKPIDRHKISKDIESSSKILLSFIQQSEDGSLWQDYTAIILACYTAHIETRIARLLKKLLEPIKSSLIREELSFILADRLSSKANMSSSSMMKFYCLIEQSPEAQHLVENWYPQVCECIQIHIKSALDTCMDQDLLYASVKTSLLLFQLFPDQTQSLLSADNVKPTKSPLSLLVESLLAVLAEKSCNADTVLLAGTAFSIMLNSLKTSPGKISILFISSLAALNLDQRLFSWEQIHGQCTSQKKEIVCTYKIACLSLIRGMIASAENKILLSLIQLQGINMKVPLILRLFPLVFSLCKGPDVLLQYHSFNTLHIWYNRYLRLLPELYMQKCPGFTQENREKIEKQSLDLIWLHWDSPVEGVSDTVADIFHIMCQMWHVERGLGDQDENALPQRLHQKLVSLPWYVKGKYKLIGSLLQFLEFKNAFTNLEEIKSQLFMCMATNHLAPAASEVYKVYMTKLAACQNPVKIWDEGWRNTLLGGLASKDEMVKRNVGHYWLLATLKFIPQCGEHLNWLLTSCLHTSDNVQMDPCQKLDLQMKWTHSELLHMWVMVSLTSRSLSGVVEWNETLLQEALYSDDPTVRLDTLSLLCNSAKKTEMLHKMESIFLKEALPLNLNIDSSPFRQSLVSSLKKLLTRIRDSCLSSIKNQNPDAVDLSINFVDWLHRLCIENLVPGSNFQRRKMCLDVLNTLYEIFTPVDSAPKKRSSLGCVKKLVDFVQKEKNLWDITSSLSFVSILLCVLDGADEVRCLAADILFKYFDWKPNHLSGSCKNLPAHLLSEALCLCNSPRNPESQSGSLICKLVFCKIISEQSRYFTIRSVGRTYEVEECTAMEVSSRLHFLRSLLQQIEIGLNSATQNIVVASKEKSLHGLIHCIEECLPYSIIPIEDNEIAAWQTLLEYIINLAVRVINMVMCILSGGEDTAGCPSFADIAMALENVISDNQMTYQTSVSLSNEYQFLLSWCWINLKESSSLLGHIVLLVSKYPEGSPHSNNQLTISMDLYQKISNTFLKVLTQCRHRGAIENCRAGFINFCTALFNTNNHSANTIPEDILTQVLRSLDSGTQGVSVTRRSAGLPILIQSICVSERKTKNVKLLTLSLKCLFSIASQPVSTCNEKNDPGQVHAINILKVLFGDNNLATGLLPHISEAVKLVISGFESPSWAIRNASTQLFSTLVMRMFGQKKTKDGCTLNTMSFDELAVHYQDLPPFLLNKLSSSKESLQSIHVQPSLFPVLTLLSNLAASEKMDNNTVSICDNFISLVEPLIGSRVYQVRELAATSLTALTAPSKRHNKVVTLLHDIDKIKGQHNKVHGTLILIEKLLMSQSWSKKEMKVILKKLIVIPFPRHSIPTPASCGMIESRSVKLIKNAVLATNGGQFLGDLWSPLCVRMWRQIENYSRGSLSLSESMDSTSVLSEYAELLLRCTTASYVAGESDSLKEVMNLLITSKCYEVQERCCQILQQYLQSNKLPVTFWEVIMDHIIHVQLNVSNHSPTQILVLDLFTAVYLKWSSHFDQHFSLHLRIQDINNIITWLQGVLLSLTTGTGMLAAILPSFSVCIKLKTFSTTPTEFEDLFMLWSNVLFDQLSSVDCSLRMAVSQSLAIAGYSVLASSALTVQEESPESYKQITFKTYQTALQLLQDDISEVRSWVSRFVHSLPLSSSFKQCDSLQCNICLQLLFEQLLTDRSGAAWDILCETLCPGQTAGHSDPLQALLAKKLQLSSWQLFDQEDNPCFAEKMVVNQLAHSALLKIINETEETGHVEKHLSTLCTRVVHKGTILFDCLAKNLRDKPLLNVSCDVQVFSIVQGLLLSTNVLLSYIRDHPDAQIGQISHLKQLHAKLEKMRNLHPLIQSLMQQVS